MIDLSTIKDPVVGIDPGLSGAVVRLEGGQLQVASKFEKLRDLIEGCRRLVPGSKKVFVEFVHSRPGESSVAVFTFGKSTGTAFGAVGILFDQEPIEVSPITWQNYWKTVCNIPLKTFFKDVTCEVAAKVFPTQKELFWGPRGGREHGVADAALIAGWGAMNPYSGGVVRKVKTKRARKKVNPSHALDSTPPQDQAFPA